MRIQGLRVFTLVSAAALLLSACGQAVTPSSNSATSSNGCGSAGSPLTVGELFPMTGREPFVGQWFLHGAKTALYDINQNGGVMGHKLHAVLGDTAGDTVDAVPAWRQLDTQNLAFELGPSSLAIMGVINLYDPAHLVDFVEGGTAQLDHMNQAYVFRTTPSDSTMARAMAAFSLHQGWKNAVLLFESTSNAQTVVPPLVTAFTKNGGTVLANIQLTPHQSSYRTEVEEAFAKHPQVVFFQVDPQTMSTLANDVGQLVGWHVPFVGDDSGADINTAKAMGLGVASKWLYGINGAPPSGQSWQHFVSDYQAVWNSNQPVTLSQNTYDAAIIASLAMTEAKSCNPQVWVKHVVDVANPPGVKVDTYAQGLAALKKGEQINFEGASGPDDFNQYHNVYGPWDIVQFDSAGNMHTVYHVTAQQVQNY